MSGVRVPDAEPVTYEISLEIFYVAVVKLVDTLVCGTRFCGFESRQSPHWLCTDSRMDKAIVFGTIDCGFESYSVYQIIYMGIGKSGNPLALGARDRKFESCCPYQCRGSSVG